MAKKKSKKIIRYQKPIRLNIGIIIFVVIFFYLMYYCFTYFTTKHISGYEVGQGTIAQDRNFTGIILREEEIFYAQDNGSIHYYCKDGTKASKGTDIYSVDETGNFYQQMTASDDGQLKLSNEAYKQLEETAARYLSAYSDNDFYQVYQFKYDMEASLMEAIRLSNLNAINEYTEESANNGIFRTFQADKPGIVVYNVDGLEDATADNFTEEMFHQSSYKKKNLINREKTSVGEPVYKMITSEVWDVVLPIPQDLAMDLANEENIKVQFNKDNSSAWALARVLEKAGKQYLILTFKNSMIRFAMERYIDLKLVLSDTSGLKIPNTSIVTKEFFTVPKEYITKGGNSNSDGVLKEVTGKDGKTHTEFVSVSLFYETETEYYIGGEGLSVIDIQNNDADKNMGFASSAEVVLVKPDSNEHYTLKKKETLQGVYNINRGYAIFKRIDILFQNEEYTIVNTGTDYGIALYDHIALDGSIIKEDDIVH